MKQLMALRGTCCDRVDYGVLRLLLFYFIFFFFLGTCSTLMAITSLFAGQVGQSLVSCLPCVLPLLVLMKCWMVPCNPILAGSVLEVPGMGLPVPGMPAAGARGCPCNGNNTTPIGPYAHVHHRNDLDSQPTMAAATVHPTSVSYQYCAFRSKGIPVKKRVPPIPKLKQCNSMCPVPSLTDLAVTSNELKLSNDSFLVYANGTLGVWGTPDILDEVAIFHQCHQYQEAGGSQQHPTTVTQQACSAVKHEPLPLGKSMKPCAGLLTVWSALDARTVVGASPCGWLQILSDEDMVLPPAGHSNGSFVYESSPGNHAFSNNKFRVGHKKFSPQPPPADSLMHFKQRAFETASAKGMKCSWLQQQGASMRGNLEIQFEVTIPEDL